MPIKIAESLQFKTILVFKLFTNWTCRLQINTDNFFVYFYSKKKKKKKEKKILQKFLSINEQKVTSDKQKVTSNEQTVMSNEQKVTSNEQRVKSFTSLKPDVATAWS